MPNFGDPIRTQIVRGADYPYWAAHWAADNFDSATVTWNWGARLCTEFDQEILIIDALTLGITEAAPLAVVAAPTIFVAGNDTIGACLGDFVNARASANSKLYGALSLAVYLTEPNQVGGKVDVSGYANTDDLAMCIYGRSVITEMEYNRRREQSQYQQGEASGAEDWYITGGGRVVTPGGGSVRPPLPK